MPDADDMRPDEEEIDLDDLRSFVDGLDPADEDWELLQRYTADRLHDRYLDTGERADLDEAIRRGHGVIAGQEYGAAAHLHDLALMVWDRIEVYLSTEDVVDYIQLLEGALSLLGDEDADPELLAKTQANLATGLMTRNRYEPSEDDRDRATHLWEAALDSQQLDDDVAAGIMSNLAQTWGQPYASEADQRRAVGYGRRALQYDDVEPDELAHREFALSSALADLHNVVDDEGLLEEAISLLRQGLARLGNDDPDSPGYTANLVDLLRRRSRETGDEQPLHEAVGLGRDAIKATDEDHPDRVHILTAAGAVLGEVASHADNVEILHEALHVYREAIRIAPDGSHEQGVALINLTSTCRDGNDRLDAPHLIEEGIDAGEKALAIFPGPGLHRAAALTALSNTLRDRSRMTGSLSDLDHALQHAQEALELTPPGHSEYAARLTNLAVLLSDDYEERANVAALDEAIALYRDAVSATERVGSRVTERLNDLALALRDRHKNSANADDLTEAVHLAARTIDADERDKLTWAGYANNFGNALAERYETTGDPEDLDRAIDLFGEALRTAASRRVEASGYATNLGLSLSVRAISTGSLDDMALAIANLKRSIDLLPSDHPDLAYRVSNLADVLRQKSEMHHTAGETAEATREVMASIDLAGQAVTLARDSDQRLLPALANLARALRWRRTLEPDTELNPAILATQRRAATLTQISAGEKFGQSALWAADAEEMNQTDEALQAYQRAVSLTTEVAWIGLGLHERINLLNLMSEVLVQAVTSAIRCKKYWDALAWADQVRSVLWRQNQQARALSDSRDEADLIQLASFVTTDSAAAPIRRERRRRLAHNEADALRITPTDPSDYQALQLSGVLVLLVPGTSASVAMIVRPDEQPQVVDLPAASRDELAARVEAFRDACSRFDSASNDAARQERLARHQVFDSLDWLWDAVAEPILEQLGKNLAPTTRVWWSPVAEFALLPIHAAGRHPRSAPHLELALDRNLRRCVPDRVISSYLPKILPAGRIHSDHRGTARLLYVSTDEAAARLDHLSAERKAVNRVLQTLPVKKLQDAQATVRAVQRHIPKSRFLHITAHGVLSDDDSFLAGFRLHDGTFTLGQLADCDVVDGELAVILTCDSAAGSLRSPNEALHVAGAAQQAGYPDVVAATMPLRDQSAVAVVTALYRELDASPNTIRATVATTLHQAVTNIRQSAETGPDPLAWVPYAHFGWGLPDELDQRTP